VRVLTVIGNRPQFIKASAVSARLRAAHEEITVHTGQHHDAELSQVFFDELGLPPAEHRLDLTALARFAHVECDKRDMRQA